MSEHPVAFMSYVRFDDQHENGRLTEFAKRLSGEVRIQTGEKFHIFQDRNDIAWGQEWAQRLKESLGIVTFLIPIITPGFFKSVACRDELNRFLEREKKLQRSDLILPVYYVNCPLLGDAAKLKRDDLASVIAGRQYADWRELRFEPFTSPTVGKLIAQMASQIVSALERGPSVASRVEASGVTLRDSARAESATSAAAAPAQKRTEIATSSRQKTEPPTRTVDALHRGDFPSISAALQAAKPGDRILIRPGLYREAIVIDKPLEIVGDGEPGEIVVEISGANVVLFKASMARLTNLTLRQAGGNFYCLQIAQGRLEVEGCDITSQGNACVAIHSGADPRLRRNRIHDGKTVGVFVYENGQGTLEDNEIFGNASAGVQIKTGGNPVLRRNRIYDGKVGGVLVLDNGLGTLEDNEISGNAFAGVEIKTGGNPIIRHNRIHDGKQAGVFVYKDGRGTLEENEIFGNAVAGITVRQGGDPMVRHNKINRNGHEAIWIYDGGRGTYEDNDLRENAKGAWDIAADCLPNVTRKSNQE